jgi:hypothetical protein
VKYLRTRIIERFNFFLERQFIKGTHVQLLFVVALIGLLSVAGGLMVLPVEESQQNTGESLWWAFLRLTDTGYLGDDEGAWRRVVSTFLTIAGNVVFIGSLVAIITTWLNRKIRNLEQGLTKVSARNHVVILGWTNRTAHIAAELFQSSKRVKKFLKRHGARNLKLIILSDDVNPFRLQELKDHPLIEKRAKEIILRTGDNIDREHLQRVDSKHASAIIIPAKSAANSELITPDVETIKTLLSLNSEMQSLDALEDKPYVVAEIQDENKLRAAQRSYSGPLEIIPSDAILSRLIAQNLHHKGLSAVFNELLSHSQNNNLYVLELPEADGKTLHELSQVFTRAILFGVVRDRDGETIPLLNPDKSLVFTRRDKLILLARKMEDIEVSTEKIQAKVSAPVLNNKRKRPPTGQYKGVSKLLVLGWNHHVPALLKELGTYKNQEFHLTLASLRSLDIREKAINHILEDSRNISCTHKFVDYIRESEMRSLDPASYDHILLVSSDKLVDEEEADARTIVGYTLLEEMLESAEKRPQVVMELTDPGNELLIKNFRSESIISPLILSNLLATIAMRRELYTVYNELFTVNGAEIIFRSLDEYDLQPCTMSFGELENYLADFQDIALGLYRESENGDVDLQMNPLRTKRLDLKENDRLVVLSTVDAGAG